MSTLIKTQFNTHNASQFVESLDEASNNVYYVFATKGPGTNTTPNSSITNSNFQVWDEMIFGKRVRPVDAAHMTTKTDWANNTAYAAYDDRNSLLTGSNYFVVTSEGDDYHVWKCIANNQSSGNSISKPLYSDVSSSLNTLYIKAADGYQWRFMYTITESNYSKFTTGDYISIHTHANASGNAVTGSIDNYIVTNSGNNYNEFCNGSFLTISNSTTAVINSSSFTLSPNNDFYNNCAIYIKAGTGSGQLRKILDYTASTRTITIDTAWGTNPSTSDSVFEITPSITINGDGSNATARALVQTSTNTIANVEVITRGQDFTYADITVEANNMNSANLALVRAPMVPAGGHGSDPIEELEGKHVGISVEYANNEASNIPTDNDFSQIGLIKDPLYANVQLNGAVSGSWTAGEKLTQANTGTFGYIISSNSTSVLVANVYGQFVLGNTTNHANVSGVSSEATMNVSSLYVNTSEGVRSSFDTFDQRYVFSQTTTSSSVFSEDEKIVQEDTNANATVFFANSSKVSVTTLRGTFNINTDNVVTGQTTGNTSKLTAQTNPDLVRNAGDILYLNNIDAVSRSNTTTETVRLVITF